MNQSSLLDVHTVTHAHTYIYTSHVVSNDNYITYLHIRIQSLTLFYFYFIPTIHPLLYLYHDRLKEPPHSERDTTSPTPPAVAAERYPSTFRRRLVLPVDIPIRR
mmetsp:Transcript_9165/g.17249  ORF Transcript_9165/g.17249 Transcript_9165/m.17249 type:complete len:105 (+) Transcript_9165:85-399(+)